MNSSALVVCPSAGKVKPKVMLGAFHVSKMMPVFASVKEVGADCCPATY